MCLLPLTFIWRNANRMSTRKFDLITADGSLVNDNNGSIAGGMFVDSGWLKSLVFCENTRGVFVCNISKQSDTISDDRSLNRTIAFSLE